MIPAAKACIDGAQVEIGAQSVVVGCSDDCQYRVHPSYRRLGSRALLADEESSGRLGLDMWCEYFYVLHLCKLCLTGRAKILGMVVMQVVEQHKRTKKVNQIAPERTNLEGNE